MSNSRFQAYASSKILKGLIILATGPTKTMSFRMLITVIVVVCGLFLTCGISLANIMLVQGEKYQQKASQQQLYDIETTAERGEIYDSNMEVLATSATVWTVFASPNDIKDIKNDDDREKIKQDISKNLAKILDLEKQEVLEHLEKKTSYEIIKKKIEDDVAAKVKKYISKSEYNVGRYIGLDESTKRFYPNNNLASVLLGFVGDDNDGLSGIEAYYNTTLSGTSGRVVAAKKANGVTMPFTYESVVEAKQGNSLVLSIDKYIQHVCEKYLEQSIEDNKISNRGAAVVMNVNTGEILAMAVKEDFNPNEPFAISKKDKKKLKEFSGEEKDEKLNQLRYAQWRNKAISDAYEPGSVFKIVTASAALEENKTTPKATYTCNGKILIAGNKYRCHLHGGHGTQDLAKAMSNSCNPAFITMGTELGSDLFTQYFKAFGFTEKTGIDLPGEGTSVYHSLENMGPTELASSSFGQTFNITPMQLISAVSASVNGGKLVQPHVVKEIIDADGNTVKTIDTVVKRQVVSEKTSETMRDLLEKVVDGGGGKNAYIAGYRIGGKTGTSEKVAEMEESGKQGLYIGSFVGVAPANKPEIAVLIMLDTPTGGAYYGSAIAAPYGGQIMEDILPYLGYEPQYTDEQLSTMAIKVPDVTGDSLNVAKNSITEVNLSYKVVGNGEKVIKQSPSSASSIYENGTVILYTEKDAKTKTVTMPDLKGKSVSAVNETLSRIGLNVEYTGTDLTSTGVVAYSQSVSKGTEVNQGTVIKVGFRNTTSAD